LQRGAGPPGSGPQDSWFELVDPRDLPNV
jgi:hypothetical protein